MGIAATLQGSNLVRFSLSQARAHSVWEKGLLAVLVLMSEQKLQGLCFEEGWVAWQGHDHPVKGPPNSWVVDPEKQT